MGSQSSWMRALVSRNFLLLSVIFAAMKKKIGSLFIAFCLLFSRGEKEEAEWGRSGLAGNY